ncbi:hypothetical protein [Roseicyclus marinus]|uniref:hypothetical protein n=1 Tax=Roseicyclus marinus TaxID=2161673 RepID=UPI00240EFA42|nr:hypothetical protein [Roseicyclus marinus]MDG3040099.1 hypothetical protein [Roseicyclus marinus]
MFKKSFIVAFAVVAATSSAQAWEGEVVACYDTVLVPAQYSVREELVRPARTEWEHRNGQAVRMHYPAVYVEVRHETRPERYVNRPAACR